MTEASRIPTPPADSPDDANAVPWSWLDALVVFCLALVLTVMALVVVTAASRRGWLPANVGRAIFLPLSGFVLAGTAAAYVGLRFPGRVRELTGPVRGGVMDALIGLGTAVGAWFLIVIGVGALVRVFGGGEVPELQENFRELAADPEIAPFFVFGAVVIAPVAEELFFRGMLFQTLRDRLGLWPGMGLSAVFFAIVHMSAGSPLDANLLIFLVIFPLGMLLAWIFQRRRTLLAPIVVHGVFNAIQVSLLVFGASQQVQ